MQEQTSKQIFKIVCQQQIFQKTANLTTILAVCGVPMRLFGRSELRMHRRGAPERLRERPGSAPAAPEQTEFLWITGGAPKSVENKQKTVLFSQNSKSKDPYGLDA